MEIYVQSCGHPSLTGLIYFCTEIYVQSCGHPIYIYIDLYKCTKIIHIIIENNLTSVLNLTETTQKNYKFKWKKKYIDRREGWSMRLGRCHAAEVMTVFRVAMMAGVMAGQKTVVSACAVMDVTPWCAE